MVFKFAGVIYFEAEEMDDALAKLGEHFKILSEGKVSFLPQEGSSCALAAPEYDEAIKNIHLLDLNGQDGEVR